MNGGRLIQHVTNHSGYHTITLNDGKHLKVNSTHHQMMYPYELPEEDYRIIAHAEGLSGMYLNGDDTGFIDDSTGEPIKSIDEPEIVFYPNTSALCIQSHPEMQGYPEETLNYLKTLLEECYQSHMARIQSLV
jgi:hypothetical protein